MKKYFPYIIVISAIFITICSEFYSIFGLSKLFSGAKVPVIIMGISLGLAKLIITASLKIYWDKLNALKWYLTFATIVLVIITSSGIYGFLSDAYQQTANLDKTIQSRIELLSKKKERFSQSLMDSKQELSNVNTSIGLLTKSLSTDNQYQTVDKRGNVLTQIQSTSKKGVQVQLDNFNAKSNLLSNKIQSLEDSIGVYDLRIIEANVNNTVGSELGPLKYLSGLTGQPMDKIVNWFLLLLMMVFDPLAIALVLTALFAFSKLEEEKDHIIKNYTYDLKSDPSYDPTLDEEIIIPSEIIFPPVEPKRKYVRKPKVQLTEPKTDEPLTDYDLITTLIDNPSNPTLDEPLNDIPSQDASVLPDLTQDQLSQESNPIISPTLDNALETKSEGNLNEGSITNEPDPSVSIKPIPKTRRRPITRQVVDTNLTPDMANHISAALTSDKKKVKK